MILFLLLDRDGDISVCVCLKNTSSTLVFLGLTKPAADADRFKTGIVNEVTQEIIHIP